MSCGEGHTIILDYIISLFVVSPLVVSGWRGYWQLLDTYVIPETPKWSLLISTAIGILGGVFLAFFQKSFKVVCCPLKRPVLFYCVSKVYTVCYILVSINHWRAVWMVWQIYTGTSLTSGIACVSVGIGILSVTRGLNNIVGPPFLVVPDHPMGYFEVPTQFGLKKSQSSWFLVDVIFTVSVTGTLIVCVWRGVWTILDAIVIPSDFVLSSWMSLVTGITIAILSFITQILIATVLQYVDSFLVTRLVENLFFVFCNVSTVSIWRGVWYLLNIYCLPDQPILSNIITASASTLILMVLGCSNTMIVRGALMDGEYPEGTKFPNEYIRFYKRMRRSKECRAELQATMKDDQLYS